MNMRSFGRKYYEKMFKLTDDYEWLAKYAAESSEEVGDKPYKFQTIAQFIEEFVVANKEPFEPDNLQGLLGSFAADAIAEYWEESQDPDAPALTSIKFSKNPSDVLAPSLLQFPKKALASIKSAIKERVSKAEGKLKSACENLDDTDLDNVIKFAVIRGYLYSYWVFVFRNPIVVIMQKSAEQPLGKKASLPLSKKAAEKGEEEEEEGKSRKIRTVSLDTIPNPVPLSAAIKAMQIVRARCASDLAKDHKNASLKASYVMADATTQFMKILLDSIRTYIQRDPSKASSTYKGQRLGGHDGKGDIYVAGSQVSSPAFSYNFISSLHHALDEIPWVSYNKEKYVFSSRKEAGPIIPGPTEIYDSYLMELYREPDLYKKKISKDFLEDGALLMEYFLAAKGFDHLSKTTISLYRDTLMRHGHKIGQEDATSSLAEIKDIIVSAFQRLHRSSGSVENYEKAFNSSAGFEESDFYTLGLRQEVTAALKSHSITLPPYQVKNIVLAIIGDLGLVTNPSSVGQMLLPEPTRTFSKSDKFLDKYVKNHVAKTRINTKRYNSTDRYNSGAFRDDRFVELILSDIEELVLVELDKVDRELGFKFDSKTGKTRDGNNSKYKRMVEDYNGSIIDRIRAQYLKELNNPNKDSGIFEELVKKSANRLAPDAFSGPSSFGKKWFLAQNNPGSIDISNLEDGMPRSSFKEIANYYSYESNVEPSDKAIKDMAKAIVDRGALSKAVATRSAAIYTSIIKEANNNRAGPQELFRELSKKYGFSENDIKELLSKNGAIGSLPESTKAALNRVAAEIVAKEKISYCRQDNFSRVASSYFTKAIGSGLFPEISEGTTKDAFTKAQQRDRSVIGKEIGKGVEAIYDAIMNSPKSLRELEIPLKEDPQVLAEIEKDPKIKPDYKKPYAYLETIRLWMVKYSYSSEDVLNRRNNPRQKLFDLIAKVFGEEFRGDHTIVNAIYEIIGDKYISTMLSMQGKSSVGGDYQTMPVLQARVLKAFPSSKERGGGTPEGVNINPSSGKKADDASGADNFGEDYEGEDYDERSGNLIQVSESDSKVLDYFSDGGSLSDAGKKYFYERALKESTDFCTYLQSRDAKFRITSVVDPRFGDPSLHMTPERKIARGGMHLDIHTPGGHIQAMMGDSISPRMSSSLSNLREFVGGAKQFAVLSFGNHLTAKVYKEAQKAWTGPNAKYADKYELMEAVGAFADPIWSFIRITDATKGLETNKIKSTANVDAADNARLAFDRAVFAAYKIDPDNIEEALRKFFQEKEADLVARFPQLKGKNLDNIITKFRRMPDIPHSQNPTNIPFHGKTTEDMKKIFGSVHLNPDALEAEIAHMRIQSSKGVHDRYNHFLPKENTFEQMRADDVKLFSKFRDVSDWAINDLESIKELFFSLMLPDNELHKKMVTDAYTELQQLLNFSSDSKPGANSGAAAAQFFKIPPVERAKILLAATEKLSAKHGDVKVQFVKRAKEIEDKSHQFITCLDAYRYAAAIAGPQIAEATRIAEEKIKAEKEAEIKRIEENKARDAKRRKAEELEKELTKKVEEIFPGANKLPGVEKRIDELIDEGIAKDEGDRFVEKALDKIRNMLPSEANKTPGATAPSSKENKMPGGTRVIIRRKDDPQGDDKAPSGSASSPSELGLAGNSNIAVDPPLSKDPVETKGEPMIVDLPPLEVPTKTKDEVLIDLPPLEVPAASVTEVPSQSKPKVEVPTPIDLPPLSKPTPTPIDLPPWPPRVDANDDQEELDKMELGAFDKDFSKAASSRPSARRIFGHVSESDDAYFIFE